MLKLYAVHLSQRTQKFLDKLDSHLSDRLKGRLKKLSSEPVPHDSKFVGRDKHKDKIFRYRLGDYRALYKVKDKENAVLIAKIDKRPKVYKR